MMSLNNEAIFVVQLTIMGALAGGAIYYRVYMWRYRRIVVIRAMTVNAIVFGCFGVGLTISLLLDPDFIARMGLSGNAILVAPSVLFLVYRFWQGRLVFSDVYRFLAILLFWWVVSHYVNLRYTGSFVDMLLVGFGITCLCLIAGCFNGLLGPVIPAFVIVHALNSAISKEVAIWDEFPYSASVELLLEFLPDWLSSLRAMVGLLLMVLGMAELIALFGVKVSTTLDRLHDWATS